MKAILRVGTFSTMMDVPEDRRRIYIPDPTKMVTLFDLKAPVADMAQKEDQLWVFEFKNYLEKDIALYIFTGKE